MEMIRGLRASASALILMVALAGCGGGGSSGQGDPLGVKGDGGPDNPGKNQSSWDEASSSSDDGGQDQTGGSTSSSNSSDIPVSTAINAQQSSAAIYEPAQNRLLIVWNDLRNRQGFDFHGWAVYGQFMSPTGSFVGQEFALSPLGTVSSANRRLGFSLTRPVPRMTPTQATELI